MSYGMTPEGFRTKRSDAIIESIFDDLEAYWGPVKRNPESVISQLVGVISKPLSRLWMEAETLYMSLDPDSAEGVLLDNICRYKNINRQGAISTTVIGTGFGVSDAIIPKGSQVSDENGYVYNLISDAVFTAGVYNSVRFVDDGTGDDIITRDVTISSSSYSYKSSITGTFEGWKSQFATDVNNAVDADLLPFGVAVIVNDDNVELVSVGYVSFGVASVSNLDIDLYGYPMIFENIETGANYVSAGQVDTIVTSVTGWDSVTNYGNGLTGSDTETDNELRIRRRRSKKTGAANTESLEVAIVNQIESVRSCRCYENTSSEIVDGLEPHSIYVLVDGGDGDEQRIADVIWIKKAFGITTNGNIEISVTDSNGGVRAIRFDRPYTVYGWVRVEITDTDPDRQLQSDWAEAIQRSIIEDAKDLEVGDDLIASKFYGAVYSVNGVRSATIQVGTSSTPDTPPVNWTTSYISIGKNEAVSVVSSENVEVTSNF